MSQLKASGVKPVPKTYVHNACGTATRVSDDMIENWVADPYFYLDGTTICAQCGEVSDADCRWEATGQQVDEYMRELRATKGLLYHCVRWGIWLIFLAAGAIIGPLAFKGGKAPMPFHTDIAVGALIGLAVAFFIGRYLRLMLCKMKLI